MNKLLSEFKRLYFLDNQPLRMGEVHETTGPDTPIAPLFGKERSALAIADASDLTRTLVLSFAKASDWETVAGLYQAVQDELGLPAPAIAVAGSDGFSVWFSLAQPVRRNQGALFLQGLRRKYLAELPEIRLQLYPSLAQVEENWVEIVPNYDEGIDKWSAFIDPSMGGMFIEEAGLDMPPNLDRQADFLAGLLSINAVDFQHALKLLEESGNEVQTAPEHRAGRPIAEDAAGQTRLNLGRGFDDPKSFLMAVMNDPAASPSVRVEAAKALLPYFESRCPGSTGWNLSERSDS